MTNDVFKVLGAVMALAVTSVILSRPSTTANVLATFFSGFSGLIQAAGNAGNGTTQGNPNA